MVYQRKDMFEEDKWNIHSSGYSTEKYGSEKSDMGEDYKHEQYGANKEKDDYKEAEDYRKSDEKEEKKKEEEENEPSIEDTVKKEEKKEEEEQDVFKIAAQEIGQGMQQEEEKDTKPKKKEHKSIEEAVNKAIKQEKETVIVDD